METKINLNNNCVYFLLIVLLSSCSIHKKQTPLKLIKVYEVATQNGLEPSGLTEWDGEFYTVSDKHDFIYKLKFKKSTLELVPVIEITNEDNIKLDFEGITHDEEFFYLVSETQYRILKVSKDGNTQDWLTNFDEIKIAGQKAGLFQVNNANIEGICYVKDSTILMVAERQPRGFIEYKSSSKIDAYQINQVKFNYENDRSPDYSGLSCHDGIYALSRNAYMVAELSYLDGKYKEETGYSYKHIINMPELQFENMEYGHAEGLVVNEDNVYLILDNNKSPNKMNPDNKNSLFLVLQK